MTANGIIKVAADGSPGSRRAYVWALSEAGRRRCAVELVTAFTGPSAQGDDTDLANAQWSAEQRTRMTMEGIEGPSNVPVSYRVVQGEPADVLVRESRVSDLLVMGSHGVEGLRHSALGSVADTCARMADCPVVIVPAHRKSAGGQQDNHVAVTAEPSIPTSAQDAE